MSISKSKKMHTATSLASNVGPGAATKNSRTFSSATVSLDKSNIANICTTSKSKSVMNEAEVECVEMWVSEESKDDNVGQERRIFVP
ncbi:hypothetical protein HPP92_020043 [Vanilla planifolia]|uniref:Uncharacterized protein n=1 Tax=Vanilla planifolia TaxID=51239 RepID=A0A835UJW7_VANPL|nr:hypothetical protein HPP92_020043 [Vanilla planifolia]